MPLMDERRDEGAARSQLPQKVREAFDAVPAPVRDKWFALRDMIFETAASTPGAGKLTETLKWGEPSYGAASGTPIRLGWKPAQADTVKLLVHCQTNLVGQWRERYGDALHFEGTRAVLFGIAKPLPEAELRHCIAMALTYRLNR